MHHGYGEEYNEEYSAEGAGVVYGQGQEATEYNDGHGYGGYDASGNTGEGGEERGGGGGEYSRDGYYHSYASAATGTGDASFVAHDDGRVGAEEDYTYFDPNGATVVNGDEYSKDGEADHNKHDSPSHESAATQQRQSSIHSFKPITATSNILPSLAFLVSSLVETSLVRTNFILLPPFLCLLALWMNE